MSTRPHEALPGVLQRLAAVDTTSLTDAGRGLRVLPAALRPIRTGRTAAGSALTVDAREDLMPVLAGLAEAGPGDVLVIAAGIPTTRWPGSCSPPRRCGEGWPAS